MPGIKVICLFASIFFLPVALTVAQTIHIIGDSHASFCFRNGPELAAHESFELPVTIDRNEHLLPFAIYWLGPITMHRIGRDGLQFLDLKKFAVQENDIAVFVFGEIDVRCHIGKQRDRKKRDLPEIINDLAVSYIAIIKDNQKLFKTLTCVICSVIPPIDGKGRNNPEYPFYGQLSERVQIARMLNKKLQELCHAHNLLFLDIYDLYANASGSLNLQYADPTVHIDSQFNLPIKKRLIELIWHCLVL